MNSIKEIYGRNNLVVWRESEHCAGFIVSNSSECELRYNEMELLSYTPHECLDGSIKYCKELIAYARFDIRK